MLVEQLHEFVELWISFRFSLGPVRKDLLAFCWFFNWRILWQSVIFVGRNKTISKVWRLQWGPSNQCFQSEGLQKVPCLKRWFKALLGWEEVDTSLFFPTQISWSKSRLADKRFQEGVLGPVCLGCTEFKKRAPEAKNVKNYGHDR